MIHITIYRHFSCGPFPFSNKGSVEHWYVLMALGYKRTEQNLKSLSKEDREIRRERRDGGEATGNEEREKRED